MSYLRDSFVIVLILIESGILRIHKVSYEGAEGPLRKDEKSCDKCLFQQIIRSLNNHYQIAMWIAENV